MRVFTLVHFVLVALLVRAGSLASVWAVEKDCVQDLDAVSSPILKEIASLTLYRELTRVRNDRLQLAIIEPLYQEKYRELTQDLDAIGKVQIDRQIKAEIAHQQNRQQVEKKTGEDKEKQAREKEDKLIYGQTFELFEGLALKQGIEPAEFRTWFDFQTLKSFDYLPHTFPSEGKIVKLGSPADEPDRSSDEGLYEITLTQSFEMQATPVTQVQWSLVMGENPSDFKTGGKSMKINGRDIEMNPNRPVEEVSWDDVQTFIAKLNRLDQSYTYRLPTEAEWEYAARAGTDTAYSFGNNAADLGEYAWYSGNSANQTHDVASLLPNASGLYDMHGNVWEWTQDWYESSLPANSTNPTSSFRVLRGGSWSHDPQNLRSARRFNYWPGRRHNSFGFRLVRTPK